MSKGEAGKSKWLFVVQNYIPEPDANGNCVSKLRAELSAQGINTDVLRVRMNRKKIPDIMKDDYGTIYSADTWMRWGRLGRYENITNAQRACRLLRVVAVRLWHRFTNSWYVEEKAYGPNACRGLRKKIEELCRVNNYEWVIAVSVPFCTQQTAASADLNGAGLALYSLDPYCRNASFSKENMDRRAEEEMAVMEKAAIHFVSLEHESDWKLEPQCKYFSRVKCIPYPNLIPPEKNIKPLQEGFFDNNKINCVYIGSLLDGIRSPQRMLELFEGICRQRSDVRLYVIGKRDGEEQSKLLSQYKKKMGESLEIMGVVDFDTATAVMHNADVLVNIGNLIPNQMPSKLLDYIAAGKPIICISEMKPCNMEPYWSRYPLMHHVDAADAATEAAAVSAAEFCGENKGKSVAWETVRESYRGFVAEDVAATMAECLERCKEQK